MEVQSVTNRDIEEGEHIDSISSVLIQITHDENTLTPKKQFRAIYSVDVPSLNAEECHIDEEKALSVIAAIKRAKYKKMNVVVSAPTIESSCVFAKTAAILGFKHISKDIKTPPNLQSIETTLREAHEGIKRKYTDDRWIW